MNKIKYIFNIHRKECIIGFCLAICLISIIGGSYYVYAKEDDSIKYFADSTELSSPVLKDSKAEEKEETTEEKKETEVNEEIKSEKIRVDIKGAVVSPGVYDANSEDRVIDIINYAGGLLDTADTSVNNLSRKVWDEMVIIIYSKDEVKDFILTKENEKEELTASEEVKDIILNDGALKEEDILTNQNKYDTGTNEVKNKEEHKSNNTQKKETEKLVSKISINTATKEELMKLNGIGASKAEAIINYRNTNGNFTSIEDLMKVKGIGEKIFAKIKDNIIL